MNRVSKGILFAGCFGALLIPLILVIVFYFFIISLASWDDGEAPLTGENKISAIECTLMWGKLAPFPSTKQNFEIRTYGSLLTRKFRARFSAPPEDIAGWIQSSTGLKDVVPEMSPDGGTLYTVEHAGGGATGAEVTVYDATQSVEIYVTWN